MSSITLRDDFTRADGPTLNDGGTHLWTTVTAFGNPVEISNNRARGSAGNFCAMVWNTAFGPDAACYSTIAQYNSGEFHYLILRSDGNATQYELVENAGTWQIYKRVSGSTSTIGSSASQAISDGDLWEFEVIGTALKGYYSHNGGSTWSTVVSTTDSSIGGTGKAGIGAQSNGSLIDDFFAGTIPAASGAGAAGLPLLGLA